MNAQERGIIEGLFERLQQAEAQGGPRDPEADALIRELTARQPAASYLLAQTVLVQEEGLRHLQERIEALERERTARPQGGAGFFGGLFGGARPQAAVPVAARGAGGSGWNNTRFSAQGTVAAQQPAQGGGFMAGAMQTAVGVAGGMLLGNAIAGLFGGEAQAAEAPAEVPEAPGMPDGDDGGALFGGLFGDDDEF